MLVSPRSTPECKNVPGFVILVYLCWCGSRKCHRYGCLPVPAALALLRSASNRDMGRIAVKAILNTWQRTLRGRLPSLSIEITRECPLRCPGCYAYEDQHLGGGGVTLRGLSDFKGQELVDGVLELVDRLKPLHLSI